MLFSREFLPFPLSSFPDSSTAPIVAQFSADGAAFGAAFSSAYAKMGSLAPESNPGMQLMAAAP